MNSLDDSWRIKPVWPKIKLNNRHIKQKCLESREGLSYGKLLQSFLCAQDSHLISELNKDKSCPYQRKSRF